MMRATVRLLPTVLLGCSVGLVAMAGRALGGDILEIELRLFGALGMGGETELPALLLDLTRTGEGWERVWGVHSNNRLTAPDGFSRGDTPLRLPSSCNGFG